MKKSIIRIVCFILLLGAVLGYLNHVFQFKYGDGIYGVTKFYELEDNTVDVLVLGSSHAFEDVNTGTLWKEYGMASYILAGSLQPLWNTYYYLKEALKTQTPEVIILEGYLLTYAQDYVDDSTVIKNNYGLHMSLDKLNSLKVSVPKERRMEFLLEYEQYHTRYTELGSADFLPNQNNRLYDDWKGFGCNMITTPFESPDVSGIKDKTPLSEKTEKYYRMIMELAQEYHIPIVVVISPYAGISDWEQRLYNTGSEIAAEYQVPFVNFNFYADEMGIDYATDAAEEAHLNYRGNQKYSAYLGNYLKENYEISDRRGDGKYDSWKRNYEYIAQTIENEMLTESSDLSDMVNRIQDPDYWLIASLDGNGNSSDPVLSEFLNQIGISDENAAGIWLMENHMVYWRSGAGEAEQYVRTSPHDFCFQRSLNETGQFENSVIVDNAAYKKVDNGVNILVYDTKTETIVDNFGINSDDNYSLVR
jgi:hypothetical protein